jgi:D-inositol-3-phosphate glycosyltransferase
MTSVLTRPKILIIGEAVAPTGFARVIRSIFGRLTEHYELHQLATRFDGAAHDWPWTLHNAARGSSVYGYDQIAPLIDELQPELIFLLYDIAFQAPYLTHIRSAKWQPKVVMYTPVEAGPIAPELLERLRGLSRYVMYTEYGRDVIEKSLSELRARIPEFKFPALEVIPHGTDGDRFFPINAEVDWRGPDADRARRRAARQHLKIDDPDQPDAFIVLNANRNMPRKRIDLTMQGFALFARDKSPNVKLYLHMATEDSGWNVLILAKRYGIYDRLIMTRADNVRPQLPDAELNWIYNACDVGITTTTGEGWGMVSFEHAATRTAQIVPRHTSLEELWDGSAEFVEPVATTTWPGNLTEGHIVSVEGVAAALQRVYENPEYRSALAERAYANANCPDYGWDAISVRWKALFDEVIATP